MDKLTRVVGVRCVFGEGEQMQIWSASAVVCRDAEAESIDRLGALDDGVEVLAFTVLIATLLQRTMEDCACEEGV